MIRQTFPVRGPVDHAFEVGSSPARFLHFVPLLKRVESDDPAIDHVGAAYTMVFGLFGREVRMPWQVEAVRPANLGAASRPSPPWEIEEVGRFGGFEIRSTTKYESAGATSVVSHVVTFAPPAGRAGAVLQPLVSAAARVGMGVVGRRYARYAGASLTA